MSTKHASVAQLPEADNENAPIVVEFGIPIPRKARGGVRKYPLDAMGIGDSFAVYGGETKRQSVTSCISFFVRTHPHTKFTTRVIDGRVRVWRIA